MLTDIGTRRGEGVVLPDEAHCVGIALLADQGDITGDVDPRRAQRHAGYRVFQPTQAAVILDMLLIILPEALEPHQDQARGLGADGTVRRINDDLGRIFNELQGVFRGVAVQHALQHGRQLPQADPARDAFAAGLRMTEI